MLVISPIRLPHNTVTGDILSETQNPCSVPRAGIGRRGDMQTALTEQPDNNYSVRQNSVRLLIVIIITVSLQELVIHSGILFTSRVIGHIGSGQFAAVKKGKWLTNDGEKEVAIKTLHSDDAGDTKRVKCLQEAAIMAQFYHPNVVYLHGIMKENKNVRCMQ